MSSINQRLFLVNLIIVIVALAAWRLWFGLDALAVDTPSLAAAVHTLETRFVASMSAVLGVVLLLQIYLHHTISRPLRTLITEVDRLAIEGSGAPIRLSGDDELAQLAHRFNALQDRIDRRLRELGQVAENVCHELKTPLTAISTATEILADPTLSPTDRVQFLTLIRTESDHLRTLAERILTYARSTSDQRGLRLAPVDLVSLLRDAVTRTHSSRIALDLPQSSALATADAALLTQAVTIILDNALRYAGDAAAISVSLTAASAAEAVHIIVIRNTGPSIPPAFLDKIFERFFALPVAATPRGTGIGLALCRDLIEAHGGHIEAMNLAPTGVAFALSIPPGRIAST